MKKDIKKAPHHSDLASATGNAADERDEAMAAKYWQEQFAADILRKRRDAVESAIEAVLCVLIVAICIWCIFALESRAEPRPGATHALVLVMEMPDAATCGEAILQYVGQGDVFCIERDDADASAAPDRSPLPRPRPARAAQE